MSLEQLTFGLVVGFMLVMGASLAVIFAGAAWLMIKEIRKSK